METKLNIQRIIIGGIAGGLVMTCVGFVIHAILLEKHYLFFQTQGAVLSEPRQMWVQMLSTILTGIPLALLYAFSRKHLGAGPMAAVTVGFLVGVMSLSGTTAEYAYYNLGTAIPLGTFADNVIGCIAATYVAGWIYKD